MCTDPIDGIGERDFSLLNVSPNPVEKGHEIKLQLGSGASHIDVYNSAGQLIHSENCYDEIRYLEMNESGLYIILVSYLHSGSKSAKVFVR